MNEFAEKVIGKIFEGKNGLIKAYVLVLVAVYIGIWAFIEPVGIPERAMIDYLAGAHAKLALLHVNLQWIANWRIFYHLILTLIITAHITLFFEWIFRRGRWAKKNIDPKAWESFHREMEGLLWHISTLPRKDIKPEDIQALVTKIVATTVKVNFGSDLDEVTAINTGYQKRLGTWDENRSLPCRICQGTQSKVNKHGQCKGCKLDCSAWIG